MKSGSMAVRRLSIALLALPVLIAGCRRAEVTAYSVPKEKDPELPTARADATAPEAPAADTGAGTMAGTAVPTAEGPGLAWTVPAGWKAKAGLAVRKGTYAVPGEGGAEAELTITAFPGEMGGELANVNRWRGQVQLPPLADLAGAVLREEENGLQMAIADCASGQGDKPRRIIGVIIPFNGGTWFFKLEGLDALVEGEKPVFLEFLKTVHPAQP